MTKKKKEMWTELELKGLLEDEDSCVYWEKVQKHLSVHPKQLKNNTVALNKILMTSLNFYDPKLDGFPLLYQNPKLFTDLGDNLFDHCFVHVDIEVEYYIFRPAVGKLLKGIVTKKGINHIRVLVHRAFSIAIQKPPNTEDWIGDKVRNGQEIKITVTHLDYEFKYPVFKGTLNPDNYLDGCQLFDESKHEQVVDEKPVLAALSIAEKKKKTNDLSENQDTEVVKKSKKKKNDSILDEYSQLLDTVTDIPADLQHRSIKLEKQSNLEGTAKAQSNSSNHKKTDENHQESHKKKTNDLSENQHTKVVKKSKKKKNDIILDEYSQLLDTVTEIPADLQHRSIKLEKLSNLEGTAKAQSNSSNHKQTDENHLESPKKKSKHHGDEYNTVDESKADLKKYKKQLQETLPDLTANTDQPDSPEKKKKKKKDKSKEGNTSFEDQDKSTVVKNSAPISEVSHVANVADYNKELQTGLTSLDQHDNVEEEFVKKKTKKKRKEKELSQDSEVQYTSETEKEYKKRLKKQILVETAANQEMQEGDAGEEQVSSKKSKKRKNTEHDDGDSSLIADFCPSEIEKNYKKKLHKGLFSSTMIEDGESNFINPEESEAEKRSKKELQNQLFKSPLKKSPKKSQKSNNLDIPVPQLNLSYPDSDDSCFSDNKEKMKKYKKSLRKSLAIDDDAESEAQPSPKKKSEKRKMNDSHDETAGGKVQIDRNCQPVFLTPKLEDAKTSKKSSRSSLKETNTICCEDNFSGSKAVTKSNQTLTPPSSDSDNVTINLPNNKKTKKLSSPSKAASKTDSGVTTSRPIKKEKD